MPRIAVSAESSATELRVFRVMIASVAIAVLAAAMFAPWRVMTGLILGGGLSLLNYHWLRSSVAAIFANATNEKPRVKASRYILRYLVLGVVVFAACQLQVASLPAAIAGLCAFVPALMVEAAREFYFIITHREESF